MSRDAVSVAVKAPLTGVESQDVGCRLARATTCMVPAPGIEPRTLGLRGTTCVKVGLPKIDSSSFRK